MLLETCKDDGCVGGILTVVNNYEVMLVMLATISKYICHMDVILYI